MKSRGSEQSAVSGSIRRPGHSRATLAAAVGLAAGLLLAACSAVTLPYDAAVAARTQRRIVVLVPGITGVELVDADSGKVVWGRGANLLGPYDRGYRLALPIPAADSSKSDSPDAQSSHAVGPAVEPRLVPGRALERIRLGPITKPVYGPIVELFEAHGWHLGDLDNPAAGDDFFLFAYDWRRDNSQSAQRLAASLEGVVAQRSGGDQPVSLICQSNGAHICRYLAKYGKAPLAAAERGQAEPPAGVRLEQLLLVGNANGGSMRILGFLNRGRKYVGGIGRKFSPEVFFSFESLYQDLPAYRADLFVDPTGQPLDIDLYDADNWQRYGWSIYGRKASHRLAADRDPDLFADAAGRDAHLRRQLAAARRFQTALERDVPVGETRYYLIQNRDKPTPDRGALRQTETGWETLITGDPLLRRLEVAESLAVAGDGHATHTSQLWLTPAEVDAFGAMPYYVDGDHFEMILEPDTLGRLLSILGSDQPDLEAR